MLHASKYVLVEIDSYLLQVASQVSKWQLVTFLVLPVLWAIFLNRVIGQVHVVVGKVVDLILNRRQPQLPLRKEKQVEILID